MLAVDMFNIFVCITVVLSFGMPIIVMITIAMCQHHYVLSIDAICIALLIIGMLNIGMASMNTIVPSALCSMWWPGCKSRLKPCDAYFCASKA